MKEKKCNLFVVLTFLFFALTTAEAATTAKPKVPVVTSVGPSCAKAGKVISINGANLTEITSLIIAKKAVTLSSKSASRIKFKVPAKIKDGFSPLTLKTRTGKNLSVLFRVGCSTGIAFKESVANKKSVVIPTTGGIVSTTLKGGPSFELQVPPDALGSELPISITPLTQIAGLASSQGVLAAAKFEPDGTQFSKPILLTLTLPSAPKGTIVGFQFSGPNNEFSLLPVQVSGKTVTFSIDHFSGAGVIPASEADFVAMVQPIINSLGTLSLTQLDDLAGIFDAFTDRFPLLCQNQPSFCDTLQKKTEESIDARTSQLCPKDLSGPLPSVSESAVEELISVAAKAQTLSANVDEQIACAEEISKRVLEDAINRALQLPNFERVNRIIELGGKFARFGFLALQTRANEAVLLVVQEAIRLAEVLCGSGQFSTAMQFAILVEDLFTLGVVNSEPTIRARLDAIYPVCGSKLSVTPTGVTISPNASLLFKATPVNFIDSAIVWNVFRNSSIDSTGSDPLINQEGNLTAGTRGGIFDVVAQSRSSLEVEGVAQVTIADITQVAISPTFAVQVNSGNSQQFFGNVDRIGPISTAVSWSATGGTISSTGLFTGGQVGGTFQIKATSIARPEKFASRSITVFKRTVAPLITSVSCTVITNGFGNTIKSLGAVFTVRQGVFPYPTVRVDSCSGEGATCSTSVNEVFGSAVITKPGSFGFSGTVIDGAGTPVSGGASVNVSNISIPSGPGTLTERVLQVISGSCPIRVVSDGGSAG